MRVLLAALVLLLFAAPLAADEASKVELTAEEQAFLDAHPDITFGPDPNWPPYERFDEDGSFQGICADHLRLVAERLGVTFRFVQLKNWDAIMEAVEAREIDCYSTAKATPDRKAYMLFTRPHVRAPNIILTRTDAPEYGSLEDLHGKKVAIVKGYWWEEALAKDHPEIKVVPADDLAMALGMLSFGSVHAMLNDPATSAWTLQELGVKNVRIAARLPGETEYAIGVRKDWPLLQRIIDKALATITPEEYAAIERRHVSFDLSDGEQDFPWLLIAGILALVLLLAVAAFAGNRMLKARIAQQTEQLRAELARREEVHAAVRRTTIDVTGASAQLAASARDQSDTAEGFEASAAQATEAVQSIAGTLESLLELVHGVAGVAKETTRRAEAGRAQLAELDGVMHGMAEANQRMGERVLAIQKSAEQIKLATVMMVKVVDQTNLLSVNSAIEAEKAGEHGRGFRIVSEEIQRLADQSAEATLQIEDIVRGMRTGVDEGVREARAAREQVEAGVTRAEDIGTELHGIMSEIERLGARFEEIRTLVAAQAEGTETIRGSLRDVNDRAQIVNAASSELAEVSQSLQQAIDGLRGDVAELGEDEPAAG